LTLSGVVRPGSGMHALQWSGSSKLKRAAEAGEKRDKKKQECIPMMMALLACYKANAYASLFPACLSLL